MARKLETIGDEEIMKKAEELNFKRRNLDRGSRRNKCNRDSNTYRSAASDHRNAALLQDTALVDMLGSAHT